jgi:hypothetical protein
MVRAVVLLVDAAPTRSCYASLGGDSAHGRPLSARNKARLLR